MKESPAKSLTQTLAHPINWKLFDAFVIGSGLGGASAAWALAQKGYRVAVLERGQWPLRDASDWDSRKILVKSQYASKNPTAVSQYGESAKDVFFNENVGGMSVFYGGAAFRFRENDFKNWPFSYADLEIYYGQAEDALTVHGANPGNDLCDSSGPLRSKNYSRTPIPLTGPSRRIFNSARSLGMHPSAVPLAIRFTGKSTGQAQCIQCLTCDGFPCKIEAKSEACSSFLLSPLSRGVTVITGIHVDSIDFSGTHATAINGESKAPIKINLENRALILAAGALSSPAILLRSQCEKISNPGRLDLIGKRLMRHCNAIVAGVFPFRINAQNEFQKQIAVFDFYHQDRASHGLATGVIQDIYTPPASAVTALAPLGLKTIGTILRERIQNLLCIAEDEAREENRVELSDRQDSNGILATKITHSYTAADLARRNFLLVKAKRILRKSGALFFQVMRIDSFSHALGTLCAGNDPKKSVLDGNCKMWGVENLWALDGSFMPSSAGVNPSLTIVANSLRVIEKQFKNIERSIP